MFFHRCVYFRSILGFCSHFHKEWSGDYMTMNRFFSNNGSLKRWKSSDKMSNFEDISNLEQEYDISSNIDFGKLVNYNPDKVKQLKMLQLMLDLWRQSGVIVPEKLAESQWIELINCGSHTSMQILLQSFYREEVAQRNIKEMQKIEQQKSTNVKEIQEELDTMKITTSGPIRYNLGCCTLFDRIREEQIDLLFNYKLMVASLYAPTILIDCSYEPYMSTRDISILLQQIRLMFSLNRDHLFPAHLFFCNLMLRSKMMKELLRSMPHINKPDYPFFYTSKHYVELYPKEKLVYLTPDAEHYLREFNCDDVYIIGGFINLTRDEPISKTKAKREGLRMAKLPIEEEIKLSRNERKSLSIDEVVSILNDIRIIRDWKYVRRHIGKNEVLAPLDDSIETRHLSLTSKSIGERLRRKEIYNLLINLKR